jgi:hypothetical protein
MVLPGPSNTHLLASITPTVDIQLDTVIHDDVLQLIKRFPASENGMQ